MVPRYGGTTINTITILILWFSRWNCAHISGMTYCTWSQNGITLCSGTDKSMLRRRGWLTSKNEWRYFIGISVTRKDAGWRYRTGVRSVLSAGFLDSGRKGSQSRALCFRTALDQIFAKTSWSHVGNPSVFEKNRALKDDAHPSSHPYRTQRAEVYAWNAIPPGCDIITPRPPPPGGISDPRFSQVKKGGTPNPNGGFGNIYSRRDLSMDTSLGGLHLSPFSTKKSALPNSSERVWFLITTCDLCDML